MLLLATGFVGIVAWRRKKAEGQEPYKFSKCHFNPWEKSPVRPHPRFLIPIEMTEGIALGPVEEPARQKLLWIAFAERKGLS